MLLNLLHLQNGEFVSPNFDESIGTNLNLSLEYGADKRPILEQVEERGILPYPPMQQFQLLG